MLGFRVVALVIGELFGIIMMFGFGAETLHLFFLLFYLPHETKQLFPDIEKFEFFF